MSKCFVLFELIFWLGIFDLSSKSVFVTIFGRANLVSKTSAVSLLNSGIVIYSSDYDQWVCFFFFFFTNFCVIIFFFFFFFFFNFTNFCVLIFFFFFFFWTKLLILGISFSTAVNAEFVAKPLILGIYFLFQ